MNDTMQILAIYIHMRRYHPLAMNEKQRIVFVAAIWVGVVAAAALIGCRPTTHPVEPSTLGVARSTSALERVLREPGPVRVQTVVGADWKVTRAGLINLEHPKAVAAGLQDGPEPIQVVFHVLHHPTRGLFLIDTGVERALRDDPERAAIRGLVARVAQVRSMQVRNDTASWLAAQRKPLAGVFLTHLHLDHVSGMPDVPDQTPIFAGPGETSERKAENFFVAGVIDRALEGKGPIREWRFSRDPDGVFAGVLDVFSDGTVWALFVPGHTRGSTAYLARTPDGPALFVGDACHTAWGWEHGVEPGTFSSDQPQSAESLRRLRSFVAKHPEIEVRLGHQSLHTQPVARRLRPPS